MNTASPDTFDFAPKDFPLKTGPSYELCKNWSAERGGLCTLMVKVALSCETGVALGRMAGIWRGVFPSTVARKRVEITCNFGFVLSKGLNARTRQSCRAIVVDGIYQR